MNTLEADHPYHFVLNLVFLAPGTSEWIQIAVITVLLFTSALISASEIAYFSLSPADEQALSEQTTPVTSVF